MSKVFFPREITNNPIMLYVLFMFWQYTLRSLKYPVDNIVHLFYTKFINKYLNALYKQ